MISVFHPGCPSEKSAFFCHRMPIHSAPGAWVNSLLLLAILAGAAGCGPVKESAGTVTPSQTPTLTETPRPTFTPSQTLYSEEATRYLEAAGQDTGQGRLIFEKEVDVIFWLFDTGAYSLETTRDLPLSDPVGDFAFHARVKVWAGLGASTCGLVFRSDNSDFTKGNYYLAGFTGFAVDDEYTFSFSFYKEGVKDETLVKNIFRDSTAKQLADEPKTFIADVFIVARQSRFEFFFNGTKVADVENAALSQGLFQYYISHYLPPNTDDIPLTGTGCQFNNAWIWSWDWQTVRKKTGLSSFLKQLCFRLISYPSNPASILIIQ